MLLPYKSYPAVTVIPDNGRFVKQWFLESMNQALLRGTLMWMVGFLNVRRTVRQSLLIGFSVRGVVHQYKSDVESEAHLWKASSFNSNLADGYLPPHRGCATSSKVTLSKFDAPTRRWFQNTNARMVAYLR
jgi:hypothetical protein